MKVILAVLIISVTFIACGGGYTSATVQRAEKGFLKFTGNIAAVMISVDDGAQFAYNPKIDLYEVKPGKHTIKIQRDNQIIVNRIIIVDNQTTFEIDVP